MTEGRPPDQTRFGRRDQARNSVHASPPPATERSISHFRREPSSSNGRLTPWERGRNHGVGWGQFFDAGAILESAASREGVGAHRYGGPAEISHPAAPGHRGNGGGVRGDASQRTSRGHQVSARFTWSTIQTSTGFHARGLRRDDVGHPGAVPCSTTIRTTKATCFSSCPCSKGDAARADGSAPTSVCRSRRWAS